MKTWNVEEEGAIREWAEVSYLPGLKGSVHWLDKTVILV
jgi:hypothetical protein